MSQWKISLTQDGGNHNANRERREIPTCCLHSSKILTAGFRVRRQLGAGLPEQEGLMTKAKEIENTKPSGIWAADYHFPHPYPLGQEIGHRFQNVFNSWWGRAVVFLLHNCAAKTSFHTVTITIFGNSFQVPKKNTCCISN